MMHTFAYHDTANTGDDFFVIGALVGFLVIYDTTDFIPTTNAHAIYPHTAADPDTDEPLGFNDVTLAPGAVDALIGPGTFKMKRTASGSGANPAWPACGIPIPVRFTFTDAAAATHEVTIPAGDFESASFTVPAADHYTMTRVELPWITA